MFRQNEILKNAEKCRGYLKEKEKMLAEDEAENENEMNVAESLIKGGSERLQKAIKDKNFAEAESASALIDGGNKKIDVLKKHREERCHHQEKEEPYY